MSDERDKLIQLIITRTSQPTIEDAVALIQFEKLKNVDVLLELHDKLRSMWVDKRLG